MRKYLWAAAVAVIPLLAAAQPGTIDGVWKTDPKTVTGANKPSRYVVKEGEYRCESCAPKIKVKADGTHQAIKGNPFVDSIAARIVDERTLEVTSKKDGKVLTVGRIIVSEDGRSMTREVTINEANGTRSFSTEKLSRVGAPAKGSHPVTGTWKFSVLEKMTDETVTFKTAAGTLSMNASDGSGYDAPLDGTRVAFRNSPGTDEVSVTSRGGTTWEEVSYSGEKATWVNTYVLSPGAATLKVTWEDKLRGQKGSYTMVRQ